MATMSTAMAAGGGGDYPVSLDVDPPAPQSRLTVFFRILMVIPHLIILAFIGIGLAVVTFIAWWAILFTGKYPAGMANFSAGTLRWMTRVMSYLSLLTGKYPAFSMDDDSAYPIRLSVEPELTGRNRLTTFFRIIMIIPHYIVLYFIQIAVQIVQLISWVIALFTGRVPDGLHTFMAGYQRWNARYIAYALLLTDKYPPFSLS
jgi:Domain of unknown function (DUF4389)